MSERREKREDFKPRSECLFKELSAYRLVSSSVQGELERRKYYIQATLDAQSLCTFLSNIVMTSEGHVCFTPAFGESSLTGIHWSRLQWSSHARFFSPSAKLAGSGSKEQSLTNGERREGVRDDVKESQTRCLSCKKNSHSTEVDKCGFPLSRRKSDTQVQHLPGGVAHPPPPRIHTKTQLS